MDTVTYHAARGFETLSTADNTTVRQITEAVRVISNEPAKRAVLTVETNSIRYRKDSASGNPSATVGHLVAAGVEFVIEGEANVRNFRWISTNVAGSSVTVTTEWP